MVFSEGFKGFPKNIRKIYGGLTVFQDILKGFREFQGILGTCRRFRGFRDSWGCMGLQGVAWGLEEVYEGISWVV